MRNLTKNIMTAFLEGRSLKLQNTRTDGRTVWLHGNAIIRRDGGGFEITIADRRHEIITHERLNGFLNLIDSPYRVSQSDSKPFFGSNADGWRGIDSNEWIMVPDCRARIAA